MTTRREAPVTVVVVVVVAAALVMSETCMGWYPFATKTVRIVNGMQNQLMIHCRGEDEDMGLRILSFMGRFQWEFHDPLWGTTWFSCQLWYTWKKKQRTGHFVVYETGNQNLRMHPCRHICEWVVKANGLYAFDTVDEVWDFELPWAGWLDEDPGIAYTSVLQDPHKRLQNLTIPQPF